MSASLIVTIIVICILAAFVVAGFVRGFLRILLGAGAIIITIILANTFSGPLADFVENKTSIGPKIQSGIESFVESKLGGTGESVQSTQNSFIDSLPLPEATKTSLKADNTLAQYADQGVSDFKEYISVNLTTIIIKALSYVVLIIVIFLIIKLVLRASKLINHIPVVGGINRFFGGVLGLAEGVVFLWVLCTVVVILAGSDLGITCQNVIKDSKFLTFIYENNLIINIAGSLINSIKGIGA